MPAKIDFFTVDLTIISNFFPFVNPFFEIFFEEDLGGEGKTLEGKERLWRERDPS